MQKKIVIIDDEAPIRLLLEQTLEDYEDLGVQIFTAANGQEGLDVIRQHQPALIFLDVMIPQIDGFEVCEKVKKDKTLRDAFVVLLTAKGQEFDKQKGIAKGADKYLTKPFDPDMIVKLTGKILDISL